MTKIYGIGIKQFHSENEIKDFQEKISTNISGYSFFMVKMNIVDLVKLSSKFPLKENYSFEGNEKIHNPIFEGGKNIPNFLGEVDYLELEESDNLISNQIQRKQRKDRLLKIWKYLRYSKFPYFPTSIVGAINDPGITFNIISNDIFEINLDKSNNSIFIVDGQHRLLGSVIKKSDLKQKLIDNDPYGIQSSIETINGEEYVFANKNMEVMLTLLVNTPIELQASIFQTINFEARRISSSMYYNLFDFKSNDISDLELSHSIVTKLINQDKSKQNSIGKKLFLSEYHKVVSSDKKLLTISQSSFANKLDDLYRIGHLFYFYEKEDGKYPGVIFKQDEYDKYFLKGEIEYYKNIEIKLSQLLDEYFEIIANIYKNEWDNPTESQVSKTTGISVFMNIFEIIFIIGYLKGNKDLNNLNLDNFYLNKDFIKEVINKINNKISFKKEDLMGTAGMGLQSTLTREINNIIISYLEDNDLLENFKNKFNEITNNFENRLFSTDNYNTFSRFNIRRFLDIYIKENIKTENYVTGFIPDNDFYVLSIAYILKSNERRF